MSDGEIHLTEVWFPKTWISKLKQPSCSQQREKLLQH